MAFGKIDLKKGLGDIAAKAEEAKKLAVDAAEMAKAKTDEFSKMASDKVLQWSNVIMDSLDDAKRRSIEQLTEKIRELIKGMNLQETIDKINEVGAQNKLNVAPLVGFIQRLKEFGDGSK